MSAPGQALQSPGNAISLGARVQRSTRISEAAAMRRLHYRNGFRLYYRCCCYSPAWARREGWNCPWWAYPRARGNLWEKRQELIAYLNRRRAS
jgi:hypothetical protein